MKMQKASIEKNRKILPLICFPMSFLIQERQRKKELESLKQNDRRDDEKEEFILRKTIKQEKWTKRETSQTRVGKLGGSVTGKRSSGSENMLGTRNMAVNKNGQG